MLTTQHFELLDEQYEDILKASYKDRIIFLDIRDLELEFGGIVTGNKGADFSIGSTDYDFAPDGMHYGPIWNRRVANKIKDKLND